MSIKVMTAVWEHSQHKGSELLLLLALADFAHDDGTGIFPSVKTMRQKVRMAERSVQYILGKLLEAGELVADGKHASGTNQYRIDLARLGGANFAGVQTLRVQPATGGGAKSRASGVQPVAPDPSVNHQEPSEDRFTHMNRALGAPRIGRRS